MEGKVEISVNEFERLRKIEEEIDVGIIFKVYDDNSYAERYQIRSKEEIFKDLQKQVDDALKIIENIKENTVHKDQYKKVKEENIDLLKQRKELRERNKRLKEELKETENDLRYYQKELSDARSKNSWFKNLFS